MPFLSSFSLRNFIYLYFGKAGNWRYACMEEGELVNNDGMNRCGIRGVFSHTTKAGSLRRFSGG